MNQRIVIRGGPVADTDPLPVKEAAAAALDSLKLAWAADRRGTLLIVALQTAGTVAEVAQLLISRSAVDGVVEGERGDVQARRLLLLGGLGLVSTAGNSLRSHWGSPVSQAANRRIEGRILDVVAAMELADVEDPGFQDSLQRALMGAQRQSMLFSTALSVPQALLGLTGTLAAMTANDRALVPLAVAGSVPRWYVMRRIQDPDAAMWGRARGRDFRHTSMVRHLLTSTVAAHELRIFDATPFLRRRYEELADETDAAQVRIYRANARRDLLGNLMGRLADAPTATRLLVRVARKEASVADAVAGGLAARKATGGVQRIVEAVNTMCRTAGATVEVRNFIRTPPAHLTGRTPPRHFSRIVVRDLSFTYPGREAPVLDGVDLEIAKGEVVALVGENGCGKTTLAKLLCSLYRPAKGTIHWDDVDVTACDPAGVRSRIAIVFQDFVRYGTLTAAENIGIGLPAKIDDRAAIVEAARRAGAHAAIEALPKGYDTVMSRQFGGADLSTGQWQRVALARAFLRDSPLVVLDEPTAALDPRAERDLFETVASLYESRSALLISHRLSSVRFAHRICVLAGGRITESGTHDELLAAGGDYAELFELQARSYR
ncbi:MAG TPA: ABC transporter ATP-binding protein [Acidimicrobiales bacterium]|nr:ABC transporter ATP-binding protein [Acidimicrobiales bacterium]